jgi:hypothetical protein
VSTQAEFDTYVAGLPSRSPSYGSPGAREYQQAKAGAPERLLTTPEGTVWADGLQYDPDRGGVIAEAKFVDNPGASVYEGTANPPPFVTEQIWADFDNEIWKYCATINDPNSPITYLKVITSTPAARDNLARRIAMLQTTWNIQFPYSVIYEA